MEINVVYIFTCKRQNILIFKCYYRIRRAEFLSISRIIVEVFIGETAETFFAYEGGTYTGSLWHAYIRLRREYKKYGLIKTTRVYNKKLKLGIALILFMTR